jgi:hypothetical protein
MFPSNLRELHIDSCNLQHINGLDSTKSSLELLRLFSMNLFYTTSLNNIAFSKLSRVFLWDLKLDSIPNSFSNLTTSLTILRFDGMYKPTYPRQFHLNKIQLSDNIRVFTLVSCYFLSLPRFGANSRLVHLHVTKNTATYFMGLDEFLTALPPSVKVRTCVNV